MSRLDGNKRRKELSTVRECYLRLGSQPARSHHAKADRSQNPELENKDQVAHAVGVKFKTLELTEIMATTRPRAMQAF